MCRALLPPFSLTRINLDYPLRGIVTSFQATAVSAMCWAVRAEGGCDRTLVWRGNPCFECPPAGNLNEFKLHLSVSCACTHAHRNVSFVLAISTFFDTATFCYFVSHPDVEWRANSNLCVRTYKLYCLASSKNRISKVIFLSTVWCQLVWFFSKMFGRFGEEENILSLHGIRTPDYPSGNVVTLPTTLILIAM